MGEEKRRGAARKFAYKFTRAPATLPKGWHIALHGRRGEGQPENLLTN
jgi:hypothetical protein